MKRNPTPRRRYRNLRSAFTLIELLVAISILSIMLFLINIVFVQTTQAVSTGIRQSNILAVARSTNDRISRDASAMLGPNSQNPAPEGGGYIVIINHRIVAPVKQINGASVEERLQSFRVDQLVFMASAEAAASKVTQFRGAAPRDASQYGSDFASPYALVRYGHGRRTNRDGSDNATWTELGEPFVPGDPLLSGRAAGLDRLANDWMLTRQAVLFNPTDRNNNLLVNTDWFANWPFVIEGTDPDSNTVIPNPINQAGGFLFGGYCDVSARPAADSTLDTGGRPIGFTNRFLAPSNPASPGTDWGTRTSNYLNLTNIGERLRVNPIPASTNFEPGVVGQLHGIFAPNCSEFIVQFAADVDGDGAIDRSDNGTPGDPTDDFIIWYDFDNLGFLLGLNPDWDGNSATAPFNAPVFDVSGSNHGTTAFVFRYNDDGTLAADETTGGAGGPIPSKWPYLIRIRYRLHDAPGRIGSNASVRLFDGIDNDLDGIIDEGSDGIDNNGNLAIDENAEKDEAIISGQYFEQIIRVPRP